MTGLPAGRGPAPFPVVATLSALLELAAHVTRKTPLLTRPQARMSRRWMFYDARRSREELGLTYGPVEVAVRDAVLDMVARGALPPRSRRRLERAHRLALPGS